MNSPHNVSINLNGFSVSNGTYSSLELSALPGTETFKSHTDNALKKKTVLVTSNSLIITVPALSTTAVLLSKTSTGISEFEETGDDIKIYPNPAKDNINVSLSQAIDGKAEITIYDITGRKILNSFVDNTSFSPLSFNISAFETGVYVFSIKNKQGTSIKKFSVIR
jgi:hypothetical protein